MHVGHGHVASRWQPVVQEHLDALDAAGFTGDFRVGIVGDPDKRKAAIKWLLARRNFVSLVAEADEGYEQVTLDALHAFAKTCPPGDEILYCHTKGAYQDTPLNHNWRKSMTAALLGNWRDCVGFLPSYDMVGCHWLTSLENHAYPGQIGTPMFAGNFWWAKAGYLASLPPVEGGDPRLGYNRFKAEEWVGRGNDPSVLDLKPGWPEYDGESSDHGTYNSGLNGRLHA